MDNHIYFQGIKKIDAAPAEHTYDIQVAVAHEFVANGIVVSNCLGKYHPHGDTAVYDSLVRMAQDFSLRYTLVDGHGNFGSVDGDEAAAMRYTECRLDLVAEDMLQDIDKETVEWTDNFDASLKEPVVLPAKIPNLMVNGSSGIAVGMATNIPPHNLREVCDAIVHLIDEPSADNLDLMAFIRGPDFPTGGIIYGTNGIIEAYSTGRGRLKVRARTSMEEKDGRKRIIVEEIPYQVNKSTMIENIAELVKDKRIEGITDLRDESDRDGMRVVIELRKDAMEEIVLNQLFTHTQMEVTFGIINLALVNNEPKVLTLREMLMAFVDYRKLVVTKRTEYELRQALARDHILQGLIKAVDAIDETIRIIREAQTTEQAKDGLMQRFELDDIQAKAILDLRLRALTGLEIEDLRAEFAAIEKRIRELEEILADEMKILAIIKAELAEIRQAYGDDRKTEIVIDTGELDIEDLIPNEEMVIMISSDGYIKRVPLDTYKQQHRGGVGLIGMETKEEDHVVDLFVTMTHNYIMFFTNKGRVYWLKAYRIPVGGRHSKGKPIINLLPKLEDGERIEDNLAINKFDDQHYLVFATKAGNVKKTVLDEYKNVPLLGHHRGRPERRRRARGYQADGRDDGDNTGHQGWAGLPFRGDRDPVHRPARPRGHRHAHGRRRRGGQYGRRATRGQAADHHRAWLRKGLSGRELPQDPSRRERCDHHQDQRPQRPRGLGAHGLRRRRTDPDLVARHGHPRTRGGDQDDGPLDHGRDHHEALRGGQDHRGRSARRGAGEALGGANRVHRGRHHPAGRQGNRRYRGVKPLTAPGRVIIFFIFVRTCPLASQG